MAVAKTFAFRLHPGDDLKRSIRDFIEAEQIGAGWVAACVGSLTEYQIRFANAAAGTKASGYFEIVSLSGTVSTNGIHLHISVSDQTGRTVGGHLLDECRVYTTAEIVIQSAPDLVFSREYDSATKSNELTIHRNDLDSPGV